MLCKLFLIEIKFIAFLSLNQFQGKNSKTIEMITKNKGLFTWEVAFVGLRSEILPDAIRAVICDLLTGLTKFFEI